MSQARGENDGFHLLPEFVCDAIPTLGAIPPAAPVGRGQNAGMELPAESVTELSARPLLHALSAPQQAAMRLLARAHTLAELAAQLGVTPDQARRTVLGAFDTLRANLNQP